MSRNGCSCAAGGQLGLPLGALTGSNWLPLLCMAVSATAAVVSACAITKMARAAVAEKESTVAAGRGTT